MRPVLLHRIDSTIESDSSHTDNGSLAFDRQLHQEASADTDNKPFGMSLAAGMHQTPFGPTLADIALPCNQSNGKFHHRLHKNACVMDVTLPA